MRTGLVVCLVAACLATGCSTEIEEPDPVPVPPSPGRVLAEGVVVSGLALRPDPAAVVAAAGAPAGWAAGGEQVLLTYRVPRRDRHDVGASTALVLLTAEGEVLGRWTSDRSAWGWLEWSPAGRSFVGTSPYRRTRLLVRPSGITELGQEHGRRGFRDGDVRFGRGWLLDPARASIVRERLPRARCAGGAQVDLRGRTWCLDEGKEVVSWTDDHATWVSHRLSTSHVEYCDGGSTGADLQVLGDLVVIGLWRADFSGDRGATWRDVDLPFEMVGAHRGSGGSFPNCTGVMPLRDGRLVLSYFGTAVATDATNTAYALADFATTYRRLDLRDGLVVGRRRGDRFLSDDGGSTWVPLRVPELLDRLFTDR